MISSFTWNKFVCWGASIILKEKVNCFCYETMSNCSQNFWIDWISAVPVLCFKRLFHIGVWTFCPICEASHSHHTLYMGNMVPAYTSRITWSRISPLANKITPQKSVNAPLLKPIPMTRNWRLPYRIEYSFLNSTIELIQQIWMHFYYLLITNVVHSLKLFGWWIYTPTLIHFPKDTHLVKGHYMHLEICINTDL